MCLLKKKRKLGPDFSYRHQALVMSVQGKKKKKDKQEKPHCSEVKALS